MTSSRQDWRRRLDYSAVKDPHALLNAIGGLLSRRSNPMREKEIAKWFYATPPEFVAKTLAHMVDIGSVKTGGTSLNRNRRVLCYWTDNRDE
jgi:hypothetical protein